MTVLELPAPTIRQKERSITARYDTGLIMPKTEYDKREKKILYTFSVSYTKAGINYWNGTRTTTDYCGVSVMNETEEDGMIGFIMGSGLGIERIEQPSNRFSKKKLEQIFADRREHYEGLVVVPRDMLDEPDQRVQDAILPYWNGQKAGL